MLEPRWQEEATQSPGTRVDSRDPGAGHRLAGSLASNLLSLCDFVGPLIVLCIGTDRSTGDALGPLVGSLLMEKGCNGMTVLGTLDEPVHAGNLADVSRSLLRDSPDAIVLAVDACLGQAEQIGTISVGKGPVKPGAGVNKVLPAVGRLHITGTVNVGGFMEYLVLQNTRLSLVMRMAHVICYGVHTGVHMAQVARREALSRLSMPEHLS